LDGVALEPSALGVEHRVDPGPHDVDTIVGGVRRTRVVPVERRGNAEIVIELPAGPAGKREPGRREPGRREPVEPTAPRPGAGGIGGSAGTATVSAGGTQAPPGRTRRIVGLGVAGAGALTMGIAGIVTLGARSDYRKALDAHCQGATDMCNDEGLSITHGA